MVGCAPSSSPQIPAATQASHSMRLVATTRFLLTTTKACLVRAMPPQTQEISTTVPHIKVCLMAHPHILGNKCLPQPTMAWIKISKSLLAVVHSNKLRDKAGAFRTCMSLQVRSQELFNQLPLANNKLVKLLTLVTCKTQIKSQCRRPC